MISAVDDPALGRRRRHAVHRPQQERVVGEQQVGAATRRASSTTAADGSTASSTRRTGCVGVAADEPDGVPALRAGGRVEAVEHGDDVGQAHGRRLRAVRRRARVSRWEARTRGYCLQPDGQRPPEGRSRRRCRGGPGRVRTDDTRGVNAVLYQLSYRPWVLLGAVGTRSTPTMVPAGRPDAPPASQRGDGRPVGVEVTGLARLGDDRPADDARLVDQERAPVGAARSGVEHAVRATRPPRAARSPTAAGTRTSARSAHARSE